MKTRLLLLFVLINSTIAFSQTPFSNLTSSAITNTTATVGVTLASCPGGVFYMQYATSTAYNPANTSVATAQAPSGLKSFNITGLTQGTTYYFRFYTPANGCTSVVYSVDGTFTTTGAITQVAISNVSHTVTATSATINYSINPNNGSAISGIQYGLTPSYGTIKTGTNATGNSIVPGSFTITGLTPSTTYYYQIYGNNQAGNSFSAAYSFTTLASSTVLSPIIEYNFNNTYYNVNGVEPFTSNTGTSFVSDRFGATGNALQINGTGTTAGITQMPVGNSSRTISVWIRPFQVNSDNIIFSYGVGTGNSVYGASFNSTTMYNFTYSSNLAYTTSTVVNNWKHMVYTYNQSDGMVKLYIDGVLASSGSFPSWFTSNSTFYLGSLLYGASGRYFGYIDDLKFYDQVLTDAQVLSLFNNNTLSSQTFNQNNLKVSLYPNPAKDMLNIEMTNEVKSVEIFNIQGQKVKVVNQKQINVSDLAAGMYMIRIEDADNAIATKKFVKQ